MPGAKTGAQRPKISKNVRSAGSKKFKKSDTETIAKYKEKLAKRAARKVKKKSRK